MADSSQAKRNRKLMGMLVCLVAGMAGLAYASVPLYRLFCQVTGYGGTPQQASVAPEEISDRVVTVRFTADVAGGLGWRFQPMQKDLKLKVGENKLAFYVAENLESKPVTGRATFNVSPDTFGPYFSKIDCFCFKEQTLQPGERVEMPVSFFIDPEMLKDPQLARIDDVTLSYTFFRAEKPAEQVGQASANETESVN